MGCTRASTRSSTPSTSHGATQARARPTTRATRGVLEDRQAALAPALKRCRFLVETGIDIPAACRHVSLPLAEALIADCVTYRDERRGVRKPHGPSESAALLPMSAHRAWLVRLCGHERFRRPATSVLSCADLGWVETDKSCACALQGLLRNLD